MPVVGINAAASREGLIDSVDAFLSEMEMLGYRDGETVRYEFRFADGNVDLQEPYAMELVDLAPDAILTVGPVTLPILKEMTSTIPIVVGFSPPATLAEHVANFDAPEGNITGCTFEAIGFRPLVDEAARLTRELLPEATTIGYLQNNNANAESNVQNINEAGASVGLSVMARLTEANDEVLPAFEALIAEGVDLIVVAGGVRNLAALPQLGEASLAAGMPTIHGSASATSQGGRRCAPAHIWLTVSSAEQRRATSRSSRTKAYCFG